TAWNTSAGILFGIQQCDTPVPGDQLGGYFISEISPPAPDLDCNGSLNWDRVKAGSTVTGEFQVGNIGEAGSLLNWEIESCPAWGNWTFTPSSGTGLADGNWVTVEVSVVTPPDKKKEFTGKVKIINSDNPTDFCEINVYLKTPKVKFQSSIFIQQLLDRLSNALPLLKYLMGF
ncbi:MAG: hypothetical protein QHH15_05895, partial [Candidatus Thermoplasmatota archaeon]|nr:hypothetical protein [Candidatus Thermoplasmatota archaeon]